MKKIIIESSIKTKRKERKGKSFSRVQLFVTPWTVAYQAPLSVGFSQKELEGVAISFSRESSQLRDQTYVSCIDRQISYDWAVWKAPKILGPHDAAK